MKRRDETTRRKLAKEWLQKAETDLQAAEHLLQRVPPLLYPSCFFSQQAAEKYLKGLLTARQTEFPKTHAIGELLDLLGKTEPSLVRELADATALSPYGVEVRYPGEAPEPNLREAKAALAIAVRVRAAVFNAFPLD